MFCPTCGNHLEEDARFCEACGTKLANDENAVDIPVAGKDFGKKLLDILKNYFKSPKETAAVAAGEKESILFAGIFGGINFLAVFFFLWRFVGAYVTKLALLAEEKDVAEFIEDMELSYPILAMWVAAIAIVVIGILATAVIPFLRAKLAKQEIDLKQLVLSTAINTLASSAVLVVGILVSFLTWWALVVAVGIVVVMWIVNACSELEWKENYLIPSGVIAAVLVVAVLLSGVLANWSFGELAHDDETMNETKAEQQENAKDRDTLYANTSAIGDMIDVLNYVDYR